MNRRTWLAAVAALAATPAALAQRGPITRFMVGFPAGGSTDAIARVIAEQVQREQGQTVMVENKPGIAGRMATVAVKSADPGESTFMVAPNAIITQQLMYPTSVLRYDLLTDLQPVATLVSFSLTFAVHPDVPANNVQEFFAWVKAGGPDRQMFGNGGLGSESHFHGEQLGKAAGVPMSVVPYRGNGPMVIDLMGGQVNAGVAAIGDVIQAHKAGRVRIIGVFGFERSPLLPEVPTMREQGFDVAGPDGWTGIWAPASMSANDVQRMEATLQKVLAQDEMKTFFAQQSAAIVAFRGAKETDQAIRSELAYWEPIIKASGYRPE